MPFTFHRSRRQAVLALAAAVALTLLVTPPDAAAALRHGSEGPAVTNLNLRLAALSYLPAWRAGSRFTGATRHAVIAFQKYARIGVDGVVGPQTSAALRVAQKPRPPRGRGRRVAISLGRQLGFLVRADGRAAFTFSVSTGRVGFRTPPGHFRVYRRERRSWSFPFGVWLPWAAYFHRGYALHGWRHVPVRPASHGCVRVPLPFASSVYRFASRGTDVVIR